MHVRLSEVNKGQLVIIRVKSYENSARCGLSLQSWGLDIS